MSESFNIKIPDEDLYPAIIDFVFDDFFKRERLNVASGLAADRTKEDTSSRQRFESWLRDGVSLVAIQPETLEIAGISLNFLAKKQDKEDHFEYPNRGLKALMTFIERLEESFDVFGASNMDCGLELCFLCVKEKFSGQGLGRKLIQESIKLAQSKKLGFIQSIPTAAASIHLFEDLSFETKAEMKLQDYYLSDHLLAFPYASESDVARYVVKFL